MSPETLPDGKAPAPLLSRHTVMSYELDSFGHVNNAVYLNLLEKARCEFLAARGLAFAQFFEWQRYPVLRQATLHFRQPARAGDRLLTRGRISGAGATFFVLEYEMVNEQTGMPVLSAETRHVFVDGSNRPSRIPQAFASRFLAGAD